MHGKTMGSLNVYVQNDRLTQTFQSWTITGDQGSQWSLLQKNFTNPNVPFKVPNTFVLNTN